MGTVVIKKNGKFFGLGKEDGGEDESISTVMSGH